MRWTSTEHSDALARNNPVEVAPTGFLSNYSAAWEGSARENQAMSLHMATLDAYRDYIDQIEDITGERLDNPLAPPGFFEDPLAFLIPFAGEVERSAYGIGDLPQDRIAEFHQEVLGLKEKHPELPIFARPEMRKRVQDQFDEAAEREQVVAEGATGLGVVGQFGAHLGRAATDLPNTAAMAVSLPWAARSILGTATLEAGIGVGVEAATLPGIQRTRAFLGRDPLSLSQMAGQVALGGVAGGVGGGIIAATGRLLSRNTDDLTAEIQALRDRGAQLDADAEAVLRRNAEIQESNPFTRSERNADTVHSQRFDIAERAMRQGRAPDLPDTPPVIDGASMSLRGVAPQRETAVQEAIRLTFEDNIPVPPLESLVVRSTVSGQTIAADEAPILTRFAGETAEDLGDVRVSPAALTNLADAPRGLAADVAGNFRRYLAEPGGIVDIGNDRFLKIRRVGEGDRPSYIVGEFQRPGGGKNAPVVMRNARIVSRAEADELLDITGTSSAGRTADAEPTTAQTDANVPLRTQAAATTRATLDVEAETKVLDDAFEREIEDLDALVANNPERATIVSDVNEQGETVGYRAVKAGDELNDIKEAETALNEFADCAKVA